MYPQVLRNVFERQDRRRLVRIKDVHVILHQSCVLTKCRLDSNTLYREPDTDESGVRLAEVPPETRLPLDPSNHT